MSLDRIDEAAAAWFARLLSPDCTERERDAFERWCAASPRHADAFAAVAQCHAEAAALRDDARIRAAARAARHARPARGHGWAGRFVRLAAAAALALAVGGAALYLARRGGDAPLRYATAVGELRRVELADGTRLQLDTDTELSVRFDAHARELTLAHGRVHVDVAEDARRPFAVRSGRGVVRDIGTQFQVARYGGTVAVTLFSGAVSVALADEDEARTLAPGEELRFGEQGGLGQPAHVDADVAAGWMQGTLAFRDRPLGDLLDEMNRYSQTKIRVADPALSALRVSGVFRAGDQASLLQALRAGWSIRSQRVSDREIALSAH